MNKISAVIITKNEEKNLLNCLKSLSWTDEIVVLDSGSKDKTVDIAIDFGCSVHQTDWLGFGRTKQLAVSLAKNDWILSIDADEVLSDELISSLQSLVLDSTIKGYRIKRSSFYLGHKIKYSSWQRDFPLRLFNRKYGTFNDKNVHESVKLKGKTQTISADILHYTYPDVRTHLDKINFYTGLSATALYAKGKKVSITGIAIRSIIKFLKMFVFNFGFMDGRAGFILAINSTYGVFIKYLKLWRLNN